MGSGVRFSIFTVIRTAVTPQMRISQMGGQKLGVRGHRPRYGTSLSNGGSQKATPKPWKPMILHYWSTIP